MKNTMYRYILSFSLSCLALFAYAEPPASLNGWNLVFNDEFDGESLDKSKWNPTYNWGHTHNHRAYCVEENVSVSDGLLRIRGEARRHPDAPATCKNGSDVYSLDYTSGAIDTRGKFDVKYGYIEGRFKMPPHSGTWPAFWTLQDGWPPEIDIFEVPHERTDHHYYLHYTKTDWYASHGSAWDHEASFGGVHKGPDKSADFHNYGLEWNENYLKFYFDDKLIASYNRPTEINQLAANYIIINLAIGGWAESGSRPIDVTSNNPAYLECDWVRVWKRNETPLITSPTIRLYSMDLKQCLQADGHSLRLGDCSDPSAIASVVDLGGSCRINFGDQVFEVPNESTAAGAPVGLWGWNGKAHQQLNLYRQNDFSSLVVTMQFAHSGHYVQTSDGAVIQDRFPASGDSPYWMILQGDEMPTGSDDQRAMGYRSVSYSDGALSLLYPNNQPNKEVCVYNASGHLLYHFSLLSSEAVVPIHLSQGVYMVNVLGEGGFSEKIVVK